jgi:uncharacterized protein (DUF2267 family)
MIIEPRRLHTTIAYVALSVLTIVVYAGARDASRSGMASSTEDAGFGLGESSTAERFLSAIEADASLPPHVTPVEAAVATTCALLDRLTPGQAHELLAALPDDVRPFFEHCYARRERRPIAKIGRGELVDRISDDLAVAPAAAEVIAAAVFHALESLLPRELIAHVARQLPHDLQRLWHSPIPAMAEDIASEPELLHQVLHDVESSGALPDGVSSRRAFVTVLCLFAQRLSGGESKRLLLALPRTVRPLVDRCLLERREAPLTFGADELTANVANELQTDLDEADLVVAAVLAAVTRILPREELDHVASQLPEDLRSVWIA